MLYPNASSLFVHVPLNAGEKVGTQIRHAHALVSLRLVRL